MKRVAIVGCGMIAKTHGLAIQDLGFECVAVTSSRLESAQAYANAYSQLRADWLTAAEWMSAPARARLREMFQPPRVFDNIAAMKEAGPLDAVIIATPPGSHCDLTCQAAQLGAKAVLCEKPMAMSAAECGHMIEVCRKNGTRLAVYHESMILLEQFTRARHIILSGQIGKVEFVRAHTPSTLMDWSTYLWAGILHLFPGRNIEKIDATLDLSKKAVSFGHAQEDSASVHFTFSDGLQGILFTGYKSPLHFIRVDGSEGSLEVSFLNAPTLRHWRQGSPNWEVVTPPRKLRYDDRREFLLGIATGDPFYNGFTGESGLRSTLPVFAAWRSHMERRPVLLEEPISTMVPVTHAAGAF